MPFSEDEVRQLKVVDLRAELLKLKLPTSGKKEELQERLLEFLTRKKKTDSLQESEAPASYNLNKNLNDDNNTKIDLNVSVNKTNFSEEERLASRAARFETTVSKSSPMPLGIGSSQASEGKYEDMLSLERLQKRRDRFGVTISSRLVDNEEKLLHQRRVERFGGTDPK